MIRNLNDLIAHGYETHDKEGYIRNTLGLSARSNDATSAFNGPASTMAATTSSSARDGFGPKGCVNTLKFGALIISQVVHKLKLQIKNDVCGIMELTILSCLLSQQNESEYDEIFLAAKGLEMLSEVLSLEPAKHWDEIMFTLHMIKMYARKRKDTRLAICRCGVLHAIAQLCRRCLHPPAHQCAIQIMLELVDVKEEFFLTALTGDDAELGTMHRDSGSFGNSITRCVPTALVSLLNSSCVSVKRTGIRLGLQLWASSVSIAHLLANDSTKLQNSWLRHIMPPLMRILFSGAEDVAIKYEAALWTSKLVECQVFASSLLTNISALLLLPYAAEGEPILKMAKSWNLAAVAGITSVTATTKVASGSSHRNINISMLQHNKKESSVDFIAGDSSAFEEVNANPVTICLFIIRAILDRAQSYESIIIPKPQQSTVLSARVPIANDSRKLAPTARKLYLKTTTSEEAEKRTEQTLADENDKPESQEQSSELRNPRSGNDSSFEYPQGVDEIGQEPVQPVSIRVPDSAERYLEPMRDAGLPVCMLFALLQYADTVPFYELVEDFESITGWNYYRAVDMDKLLASPLGVSIVSEGSYAGIMLAFAMLDVLQYWINLDSEVSWFIRRLFLEANCPVVDMPCRGMAGSNKTVEGKSVAIESHSGIDLLMVTFDLAMSLKMVFDANSSFSRAPRKGGKGKIRTILEDSPDITTLRAKLFSKKLRQLIEIPDRVNSLRTELDESLLTQTRDISAILSSDKIKKRLLHHTKPNLSLKGPKKKKTVLKSSSKPISASKISKSDDQEDEDDDWEDENVQEDYQPPSYTNTRSTKPINKSKSGEPQLSALAKARLLEFSGMKFGGGQESKITSKSVEINNYKELMDLMIRSSEEVEERVAVGNFQSPGIDDLLLENLKRNIRKKKMELQTSDNDAEESVSASKKVSYLSYFLPEQASATTSNDIKVSQYQISGPNGRSSQAVPSQKGFNSSFAVSSSPIRPSNMNQAISRASSTPIRLAQQGNDHNRDSHLTPRRPTSDHSGSAYRTRPTKLTGHESNVRSTGLHISSNNLQEPPGKGDSTSKHDEDGHAGRRQAVRVMRKSIHNRKSRIRSTIKVMKATIIEQPPNDKDEGRDQVDKTEVPAIVSISPTIDLPIPEPSKSTIVAAEPKTADLSKSTVTDEDGFRALSNSVISDLQDLRVSWTNRKAGLKQVSQQSDVFSADPLLSKGGFSPRHRVLHSSNLMSKSNNLSPRSPAQKALR